VLLAPWNRWTGFCCRIVPHRAGQEATRLNEGPRRSRLLSSRRAASTIAAGMLCELKERQVKMGFQAVKNVHAYRYRFQSTAFLIHDCTRLLERMISNLEPWSLGLPRVLGLHKPEWASPQRLSSGPRKTSIFKWRCTIPSHWALGLIPVSVNTM